MYSNHRANNRATVGQVWLSTHTTRLTVKYKSPYFTIIVPMLITTMTVRNAAPAWQHPFYWSRLPSYRIAQWCHSQYSQHTVGLLVSLASPFVLIRWHNGATLNVLNTSLAYWCCWPRLSFLSDGPTVPLSRSSILGWLTGLFGLAFRSYQMAQRGQSQCSQYKAGLLALLALPFVSIRWPNGATLNVLNTRLAYWSCWPRLPSLSDGPMVPLSMSSIQGRLTGLAGLAFPSYQMAQRCHSQGPQY